LYSISARTISFSELVKVLTSSMNSVAFLLLIMMVSTILAKCVVLMRIPDMLLSLLAGTPGWVFILIIMIFCIFLGCFLEGVAITTLTVPVVVPMLNAYGYDLIWYGVLLTVNLTIAAVTPPVGLNLFVMQKIGNLSIGEVTRGAMPFLFIVCVLMLVIAAFPQLSLFLPAHMGR
jgi:C4-dicarboxylate transporter DctM subunit